MFRLFKSFSFEASHQLMDHDGKCANLHGHSWKGQLIVRSGQVSSNGAKRNMVMDYSDLGWITDRIEEMLDHKHLNDVLVETMPTSEYLAQWIFNKVKEMMHIQGFNTTAFLEAVTISETCSTKCEYYGETLPH